MNQAYYHIAGLTIRMEGHGAELTRLDGFRPFRIEAPEGEPTATIRLDATMKGYDFESAEWIYSSGEDGVHYEFGRHSEGFCYRSKGAGEPLLMWQKNGSSTIECNADMVADCNPWELRFMLWVAYGLIALPYGAVAIHTSVIMKDERAYMFLGESGTGKSTHTRLWRENIEGAELLNDDSPIIRIEDGEVVVYGSPWSGKTPCYKPLRVALGGVTRLSQAPHNRMRRLSRLEAMGALLPSCPPNFAYDEALTDRMCEVIGAIIRNVKVCHLECLPDGAAARLSFETLTRNE